MLTFPLTGSDNLQIARDHIATDRLYVATTDVYATRRQDNSVNMQLLTWMSAGGEQDIAGGRLNATLSVFPDSASIQAAGINPQHVKPMPWRDVTVVLRGPGFETTPSQVVLRSNGEALVSLDLDRQTALILRDAFENPGLTPVSAEWSGIVDLHFPSIRIQASADRTLIESRIRQIGAGTTREIIKSVVSANIKIEITAGTDEESERLIRDWCLTEISKRFAEDDTLLIEVNAADIIAWPIVINSTLSLDAVNESNSRSIVLSEDEIGTPQHSSVRVLADFNENLQRVDVDLDINSAVQRMAFTNTDTQELARPVSPYKWRWRANYTAKTTSWSDWNTEPPSDSLLVTVPLPGTRKIEIVAGRLDLVATWEKVIVTLSSNTQEPVSDPIVITRQTRSITLQKNELLGASLSVTVEFIAYNGQTIIRTLALEAIDTILALNDPFSEDTFSVTLVPVGTGWRDVALAMVDLRLVESDVTWSSTQTLDTPDATAQWRAPKRQGGNDTFEWRTHISLRDGTFKSSGWQRGDSTLLSVRLDAPDLREVLILALSLKPGEEAVIELEQNGQQWSTNLVDSSPVKMELPPGEYNWLVRWKLGGQQVTGETITTSANVVILPPSP